MNEAARERTVLLLEDDFALARLLTRLLHDLGLRVLVASSGSAGAALLEQHQVDLIILDMGVAPFEAMDFLRDASMQRLMPPVIVLSSRRAVRRGEGVDQTFRVLTKPFHVEELIRSVLGGLRTLPGDAPLE